MSIVVRNVKLTQTAKLHRNPPSASGWKLILIGSIVVVVASLVGPPQDVTYGMRRDERTLQVDQKLNYYSTV